MSREQVRERLVQQYAEASARVPPVSGAARRPAPGAEATYQPGDRVTHPSFGPGIVLSTRLEATAEIVEVNFAGKVGVKRLDLAYAPLQRA